MFYTFHGAKRAICGAEVVIVNTVGFFFLDFCACWRVLGPNQRWHCICDGRGLFALLQERDCGYAACFCLTYLFRKANDQAILRLAHQRLEEILAAGGQHGPVPAELLALHQDSHIAQDILLPLVVQAEEDIGTMNRRLIHIHGGFRLLIYGHSAHALEIEAQQRGVSLQAQLSERIPHG